MTTSLAAKPQLSLIWAQSLNGVIGRSGTIPWHEPTDLAHFQKTTRGGVVIMGRHTWESLPVTPLPQRVNIVLTSDRDYHAPGARVVTTPQQALDLAHWYTQVGHQAIWVIGGRQVYDTFMDYATQLIVTTVGTVIEGDTEAPRIPPHFVPQEPHQLATHSDYEVTVTTWLRTASPLTSPRLSRDHVKDTVD